MTNKFKKERKSILVAEAKIKAGYEARIVQLEQQIKAALINQDSSILPEQELQKTKLGGF